MADYIDREKYCNEICRCDQNYCDKSSCPIWKAPSENVAPVVHARWIKCFDERKVLNCHSGTAFKCSHCNRRAGHKQIKFYDFCPKCGAIMDAEEDG